MCFSCIANGLRKLGEDFGTRPTQVPTVEGRRRERERAGRSNNGEQKFIIPWAEGEELRFCGRRF